MVGAKNSSNSNRLREIGNEAGTPCYLIADGSELQPEWFNGAHTVGITAGLRRPKCWSRTSSMRCAGWGRSRSAN